MFETEQPTMRLTPHGASVLRAAKSYAETTGCDAIVRRGVNELNLALSKYSEGELWLPDESGVRRAVASLLWTAREAGPQELRKSFAALHGIVTTFDRVVTRNESEALIEDVMAETAVWQRKTVQKPRLPRLHDEVYAPFAKHLYEIADALRYDAASHVLHALDKNSDVLEKFRHHRKLRGRHSQVTDSLYILQGMICMREAKERIAHELFGQDEAAVFRALAGNEDGSIAKMVSVAHRFSGLFLMSIHGVGILHDVGKLRYLSDHARDGDAPVSWNKAVAYGQSLDGEFASDPIAEQSRLDDLWSIAQWGYEQVVQRIQGYDQDRLERLELRLQEQGAKHCHILRRRAGLGSNVFRPKVINGWR